MRLATKASTKQFTTKASLPRQISLSGRFFILPWWSSFAPAPDGKRRCTKIAPKPSTTYNVCDMAACG